MQDIMQYYSRGQNAALRLRLEHHRPQPSRIDDLRVGKVNGDGMR